MLSLLLLVRTGSEVFGISDQKISCYVAKDSKMKVVHRVTELLFLVEVLFNWIGWQKMKDHILMANLWTAFMTFGVLPFYSSHYLVIYWVWTRAVRKFLRYLYRLHLDAKRADS